MHRSSHIGQAEFSLVLTSELNNTTYLLGWDYGFYLLFLILDRRNNEWWAVCLERALPEEQRKRAKVSGVSRRSSVEGNGNSLPVDDADAGALVRQRRLHDPDRRPRLHVSYLHAAKHSFKQLSTRDSQDCHEESSQQSAHKPELHKGIDKVRRSIAAKCRDV